MRGVTEERLAKCLWKIVQKVAFEGNPLNLCRDTSSQNVAVCCRNT
jgi:hypothetical protein